MAVILIVRLIEIEGVLKLALHVGVGRKRRAHCGFALRVELQQLAAHVGHGLRQQARALVFCHPCVPSLFSCGAGFRRRSATVFLDQIRRPRGGQVYELRLVRELENHQFQRRLLELFDDP